MMIPRRIQLQIEPLPNYSQYNMVTDIIHYLNSFPVSAIEPAQLPALRVQSVMLETVFNNFSHFYFHEFAFKFYLKS